MGGVLRLIFRASWSATSEQPSRTTNICILGKSLLFCWVGGFMLHLLDDTKSVSVAAAWKKKLGTCFFWFSGGSQSGEI